MKLTYKNKLGNKIYNKGSKGFHLIRLLDMLLKFSLIWYMVHLINSHRPKIVYCSNNKTYSEEFKKSLIGRVLINGETCIGGINRILII